MMPSEQAHPGSTPNRNGAGRFGAFGGVFTPSILTILGVIMYLRVGWVVGAVGLGGALLIVALSHVISLTSGLSVASIATNRTVRAGGAYYMISRSLGAQTGAAIGVPLFLGQALSTTFYIVGFTEALSLVLPQADQRIVGTVVLVLLSLAALKSADLAMRVQYVIMGLIGLSLISLFAGDAPESTVSDIVWFTEGREPFSKVFAVFFPAVTGIMAAVSMSGDLKNPRKAIPRGTIIAILVGLAVYLFIPFFLALRVSGDTLYDDTYAMWNISRFPALIYIGVWGATLSSAMGSILGAPRTLQALSRDGLAPKILGRGHGPTEEPRLATLFTFVLAEAGILLGNLDVVAPILTMFFLATYGMTNLACGLEKWAATPSFRPSFKVPSSVSLIGALACFYVMSIINLPAMLAALGICLAIYLHAQRRAYGGKWADARHGIWAALVRMALLRLRKATYHPRNWRPNLVVFGGDPNKRSHLLDLSCMLVQERGLVSYFVLVEGDVLELAPQRKQLIDDIESRFALSYPNVLYRVDIVPDVFTGMVTVAQSYGIGTFETNVAMVGWQGKPERGQRYVRSLRELVALDCSLLLVRQKPVRGLGRRKRIDVWWGGLKGNGGLMLLIAFLLKTHESWQDATIRLITVVGKGEEIPGVTANLEKMLGDARMDALPCVLAREGRPIGELMEEVSTNADLAIVGLRLPDPEEPVGEFFSRTNAFLAGLPTTIMVYSARHFEGEPVLFDD